MVDKEVDGKEYTVDSLVFLASSKVGQAYEVFHSIQDRNLPPPIFQKVLSNDKLQKAGMLHKVFLHNDTIHSMATVAFSP